MSNEINSKSDQKSGQQSELNNSKLTNFESEAHLTFASTFIAQTVQDRTTRSIHLFCFFILQSLLLLLLLLLLDYSIQFLIVCCLTKSNPETGTDRVTSSQLSFHSQVFANSRRRKRKDSTSFALYLSLSLQMRFLASFIFPSICLAHIKVGIIVGCIRMPAGQLLPLHRSQDCIQAKYLAAISSIRPSDSLSLSPTAASLPSTPGNLGFPFLFFVIA